MNQSARDNFILTYSYIYFLQLAESGTCGPSPFMDPERYSSNSIDRQSPMKSACRQPAVQKTKRLHAQGQYTSSNTSSSKSTQMSLGCGTDMMNDSSILSSTSECSVNSSSVVDSSDGEYSSSKTDYGRTMGRASKVREQKK